MKATELIRQLTDLVQKHGDLEVEDTDDMIVTSVEVQESYRGGLIIHLDDF